MWVSGDVHQRWNQNILFSEASWKKNLFQINYNLKSQYYLKEKSKRKKWTCEKIIRDKQFVRHWNRWIVINYFSLLLCLQFFSSFFGFFEEKKKVVKKKHLKYDFISHKKWAEFSIPEQQASSCRVLNERSSWWIKKMNFFGATHRIGFLKYFAYVCTTSSRHTLRIVSNLHSIIECLQSYRNRKIIVLDYGYMNAFRKYLFINNRNR